MLPTPPRRLPPPETPPRPLFCAARQPSSAGAGPPRVCGSSELRRSLRNQVLPPQRKSSVTGEEADHPGWPRARTQAQEPGASGESWPCHRAAVWLCESPRAVITDGHERGGLKQQDRILSVLEARSLKSRRRQGWPLPGAPRDNLPHALRLAPGGFLKPQRSLQIHRSSVRLHLPMVSIPVSLCLPLFLSLVRTHVIESGAHPQSRGTSS